MRNAISFGRTLGGKSYSRALDLMRKVDSPTPAVLEQLVADLRHHGQAIVKDGKRIDPAEFYATHEPSNKTAK